MSDGQFSLDFWSQICYSCIYSEEEPDLVPLLLCAFEGETTTIKAENDRRTNRC